MNNCCLYREVNNDTDFNCLQDVGVRDSQAPSDVFTARILSPVIRLRCVASRRTMWLQHITRDGASVVLLTAGLLGRTRALWLGICELSVNVPRTPTRSLRNHLVRPRSGTLVRTNTIVRTHNRWCDRTRERLCIGNQHGVKIFARHHVAVSRTSSIRRAPIGVAIRLAGISVRKVQ